MTYPLLRKFYDSGVAEPKFKIGENLDSKDFFDTVTDEETVDGKAEDKSEEKADDKKEDKVEDKKEEKVEEKKEESKPDEKKVEVKEPDWKEIVSKQNKKDVLSLFDIDEDALNLANDIKGDDFLKKAVTYRKNNGNLTPFIEAATKDWTTYSHQQLIMDDLQKQYSALSPEKREKLAKSDYSARFVYKDDPELSPAENAELAELMAIKLEAEGEKIRSARVSSQKEFMDSVKPVEKTSNDESAQKAVKEYQDKIAKDADKFKSMVENDPAKAKLFSTKQIVLGSKENSFNRSVNPDSIIEQAYDVNKFDDLFWENGKFNFEKWAKVSAYAQDMEGTEDSLINHGRSLSTKQISEKELDNAKEQKNEKKDEKKKSLAKTFAENGVVMNAMDL